MNVRKEIEVASLALTVALFPLHVATQIQGTPSTHVGAESQFATPYTHTNQKGTGTRVDFSLWSQNRISAYKKLVATKSPKPRAVLSIPRLQLSVPVFEGTDEDNLNRGAGRITDTAQLGTSGNAGIAAHRDGFFRILKDIEIGDTVELQLPNRKKEYTVTVIEIVDPEDVRVLKAGSRPSLTLVTCFPFYFVGDAPQRFIVHADESGLPEVDGSRRPSAPLVSKTKSQVKTQ